MCYLLLLILYAQMPQPITWPVSDNFPIKGYGDYNGSLDDFHGALDFPADSGEAVIAAYPWLDNYVIVLNPGAVSDAIVMLSENITDPRGWTYEHIDASLPDYALVQDSLLERRVIAPCCDHELGRHVHLTYLTKESFDPTSPLYLLQPGYFSPFDFLVPNGNTYDIAAFGPTRPGMNGVFASNRGIFFQRDGWVLGAIAGFQDRVYGAVDIVVRPYNMYVDLPSRDSCGVKSVKYRILSQDPYFSDPFPYIPHGFCNWRILFDMDGYIPDDGIEYPMPEFCKVFFGSGQQFDNNICLTNCGPLNSLSEDSCLQNVWIDDYDREADWEDYLFCRGAWDTRLGQFSVFPLSPDNWYAAFPDGRYAVEVTAESQDSELFTTEILPVANIDEPYTDSDVIGIIVDNYAPHLSGFELYQMPDFCRIISGYFQYIDFYNPEEGRALTWSGNIYVPVSGGQHLGLAVCFSEPVDTVDIPVTLNAYVGPNLNYSTSATFEPVEWNDSLGFVPYGLSSEFWYCTEAEMDLPTEYVGRLEITIGEGLSSVDLAGNGLDGDPCTFVPPRDMETGGWDYTNWEDIFSPFTALWGVAKDYEIISSERENISSNSDRSMTLDSERSMTLVRGYYPPDFEIDVSIPSQHQTDAFLDDCNYYSGFWTGTWINEDDLPIDLTVFGSDGAFHETRVYSSGADMVDVSNFAITPMNRDNNDNGRYCWVAWQWYIERPPPPYGVYDTNLYVTVCDAENLSSYIYDVGFGQTWGLHWYSNVYLWGTVGSSVYAWVRTYIWPDQELVVDTVLILDPPSLLNRNLDREPVNSKEIKSNSAGTFRDEFLPIYPCPTSSSVTIPFSLAESGTASIDVFDISGHLITTITNEEMAEGIHNLFWNLNDNNGSPVPSGVYYVRLCSGSFIENRKLVVIR